MSSELGHLAVLAAFMIAIVQSILPLWGSYTKRNNFMELAVPAAIVQFILILLAFLALTYAFVVSDFSNKLVANNSHSLKPMLYKVSGVWGNHEGSMLLWILILAFYGAMVAWFGAKLPSVLKARVLSVQSMISVAFLAFLIFTSNPFERLLNPPLDGADLNPLLQDPGLAFHPPFLYLGYVGLSMTFSFAIAALLGGRVDAAWARWVRPWALVAWVNLTIGIGLGSWWAYYELGWGGWWFWDPVENASFMPWLISIALLHSAIVVEKRETLKSWTILLAILAFSFSLIGTFIVRSGVITSVHAFANDPERGVFILLILIVAIGGALTLYAIRASQLKSTAAFSLMSRESGLVLNNLLLVVSAFVVFVGTIWPLVAEYTTGKKLSVGAPFFNQAFTPFMLALAIALPIGALLPWKRAKWRNVKVLIPAMMLAAALAGLLWAVQSGRSIMAPIGLALALWIFFGVVVDLAAKANWKQLNIGNSLRRLRNLPLSDWGKSIGHLGFAITIFGIAAITAWESEDIRVAKPGEVIALGGYEFTFETIEKVNGPNYSATRGSFTARQNGRVVASLLPETRFYPVQRMTTTEAGIDGSALRDLYISLGGVEEEGLVVRTYVKPFANWIWAGAIIMALGGLLSAFDRRLRMATLAPKAKREGAHA